MLNTRKWLITSTPPTTNGDLHVGHLSGPYLAADIFRRARIVAGDEAVLASFGDDNQSYIVTTAERLRRDPEELVRDGNAAISSTLAAFDIEMDYFKPVDANHQKFLKSFFISLAKAGVFKEREVELPFDTNMGRFLFESFIHGFCPVCLSETKGGICEDCGHPNDSNDLLNAKPVGGDSHKIEYRSVRRLYLNLDDFRDELVAFYNEKRGSWRPHILRLVTELLAKESLGDFPMTLPMERGASVDLPGWEGHVWNAMAEMGPGLLNALENVQGGPSDISDGQLVQFLGYDNSYFFAIINVCLQLAASKYKISPSKLPNWIFTNEFYSLENMKFSTSKGHAIWGRELLKDYTTDEVRLYISMNAPELSASNYLPEDMSKYVREEIRPRLSHILSSVNRIMFDEENDQVVGLNKNLSAFKNRFDAFYSPEAFSPRESANFLMSYFDFCIREMEALLKGTNSFNIRNVLDLLVKYSAPLIPTFSQQVSEHLTSKEQLK